LIVALLGGVGFLADSFFGTLPLFLLVGVVVGFAAGLFYLYRMLKRMGGG
jgi:F0F1-type ATP synthase assembly protein I